MWALLKEHIARKKLTQAAAARLFGVSQPRISDLVRGKLHLFCFGHADQHGQRRRHARRTPRQAGRLNRPRNDQFIDRTTGRLGCEYEWGVHIAFFARRVGLDARQVAATVTQPSNADCWPAAEKALLSLVDDLVDCRTIATATWHLLAQHLDEAQILEAIALVGYYHMISFFCRGLDLPLESYAARFPTERET